MTARQRAVQAAGAAAPAAAPAPPVGVGVVKTEDQKNDEAAKLFMERLDESLKKKGDVWSRDEDEVDKVPYHLDISHSVFTSNCSEI